MSATTCDAEACHETATHIADTRRGQLVVCRDDARRDRIRHAYDGQSVPIIETIPL